MQNFPDEHVNRRKFVKTNMQAITRLGFTQSFAQTAWESKSQKKRSSEGGESGGGIIRL